MQAMSWIDSLPRAVDDTHTMVRLTPRKASSAWSARNKAHIEVLRAQGLMHASGLAAIEAARARGTWALLDEASERIVPDDLAAALAALPPARAHFDAFPPSAQRAILEWLSLAKRPATRAARIAQIAEQARENKRANAWPR